MAGGRIRGAGLPIAVAAFSLFLVWPIGSSEASPEKSAGGGAAPGARAAVVCTYGQSCRIAVGQTATWAVQAWCYDVDHNQIDDTVTISISGNPTAGGTSLSIRPNPVHTFKTAIIRLVTTVNTTAGHFDLAASGNGPVCGFYAFSPPSTPVDIVKPINWQQVGPGQQRPNGVLHFDYAWESSSGNLADLSNCKVGEKVDYPGTDDPYVWASPPYAAHRGSSNPTILWVDATKGVAQDNHSHEAFLKPYVGNSVTAKQAYRFKCASAPPVDFGGWSDVTIKRVVKDTTGKGCFLYGIGKTGSRAIQRLPDLDPGACTKGPGLLVSDMAQTVSDVSASVTLPEASVSLNEPIYANLTLANRGAEETTVDLGLNGKSNIELTVQRPNGAVATYTLSGEGFGQSGEVTLAPGASHREKLLLNEWYRFDQPGVYLLQLRLKDGSKELTRNDGNKLSLEVQPVHPLHLRDVAETLADRAVNGSTYEERRQAANALSYMTHPAALPALARVLRHGSLVEDYAVVGLGRIGTPEAAAILAAAQNHRDQDVRAQVLSTLRSLRTRPLGESGVND